MRTNKKMELLCEVPASESCANNVQIIFVGIHTTISFYRQEAARGLYLQHNRVEFKCYRRVTDSTMFMVSNALPAL